MKIVIKRTDDDFAMEAKNEEGNVIHMDGPPHLGGHDTGFRPTQLLLAAVGGCSAIDVVMILKKARQPVTDCVVELEADRAETEPRVFTKIHLHYRVKGNGLDPNKVRNAVELSKEKYCSATIMLAKTAEISYAITIDEGVAQ